MAAKVLDDILNNFLSLEVVLKWLSKDRTANGENIFLDQYECSQVDFVSHFLFFLREQSSTYFQVFDPETPRKNSHSQGCNVSNFDNSTPQTKVSQDFSTSSNHFDVEFLNSFPSLSSSSSIKTESGKKILESTPNSVSLTSSEKDVFQKKCRKVKLFSENTDGKSIIEKDIKFLDDVEIKQINENRIIISTPKLNRNETFPITDYFNLSDLQTEASPNLGSKLKWKNQCSDLSSPEFNAPKSKSFSGNSSFKNKDNKRNCGISLGDFILNDSNSSENKKEKKNKSKKKIIPLRLSQDSEITVNLPFNKCEDYSDNKYNAVEEKVIVKSHSELVLSEDEEPMPCENSLVFSNNGQPELELVTHISELRILSQIYSCLINENYCQNIMIELCFIISLLVVQDFNRTMPVKESNLSNLKICKDTVFFGSIHNCVFFAVETLWLQRSLLVLLNLSALKLLSENIQIEKFNLKLKEFLVNAYSKKQSSEEIKRQNGLVKTGMQGNVSFQYETDNRENFTSDVSFHCFKKQRDLFYNILAIWEANHLTSGWVFQIGLSSKIRTLLSISSDPINLLHFSRLFRNQLIMSCCGESQTKDDFNEDILQLLPSADPNKILRLRARLTSSSKRQGPCPLPDFTGHQEFYKDFILCSSHSVFYEHLKNSLCDEILRLNDSELTVDVEDDDSSLDEQVQERYLQSTNILRLLAKFLGFLVFLPYRGEKPFSDRIFHIHCSVRHNILPLFDVVSCLKTAIKKQKLTLTIPWIVSYLSMIDAYSANLETYQNVWVLLIAIYKNLKSCVHRKNRLYLNLTLGWFFQLPSLQFDQFYSLLDKYIKNSTDSLSVSFISETKTGLDSYDFVEENILYTVCPFLNEINVILSENSGCSVRHIRPVTTHENLLSKSQASKQLELKLESNFLNNQSSSTRKTVEFVTERVASIVIKHLVHNVIPKIKENTWNKLENLSSANLKEAEVETEVLSESCFKELMTVCEKENWEISFKRSDMALKALLSNELQGSVSDTCAKIATRQATEKVQRWMQSHVTLSMIKSEFMRLTRKKFAKQTPSNNISLDSSELFLNKTAPQKDCRHFEKVVEHDEEAWPASLALKAVRDLMWTIYENRTCGREIEEILDETIKTVSCRKDVTAVAEKALMSLVVDLIVVFCVLSEDDVSQELLKKFFQFLKFIDSQSFSNSNLERIVCPRNIALVIKEAKNKQKAWGNLGNLLISLMEENFLTKDQVEAQLLSLLRRNWEKEDGVEFSSFISQILDQYSKSNVCDKFTLLLECMLETFDDDEPKSETIG